MTESVIKEMLAKIDVQINGSRPWDIQIHNHRLWDRVIRQGSLGLGEASMAAVIGNTPTAWSGPSRIKWS